MSDLIPMMRFDSSTGVVEHLGEAPAIATSVSSTGDLDASREGADPKSALNAIDNRLAWLDEQQAPLRTGPDGKPIYRVTDEMRAKHLREAVRPYQEIQSAQLAQRQEAAAGEREQRLQNEQDQRDAVEAEAYRIALEAQAKARATQIAKDLRLPHPVND